MKRNRKFIKISIGVIILLMLLTVFIKIDDIYKNRYNIVQYSSVERMMPAFRSLRKISDVLFMPTTLF
jgi:hypothetical protein